MLASADAIGGGQVGGVGGGGEKGVEGQVGGEHGVGGSGRGGGGQLVLVLLEEVGVEGAGWWAGWARWRWRGRADTQVWA